MKPVAYVGRCPQSGCTAATERVEWPVGTSPFPGIDRVCPVHNLLVKWSVIRGSVSGASCDDRCRTATNSICRCSCGGEQHGAAWSALHPADMDRRAS